MVTKNELVAIIAALTTDFDTPPASQATSPDERDEAQNDAYAEPADAAYVEHRKRAV